MTEYLSTLLGLTMAALAVVVPTGVAYGAWDEWRKMRDKEMRSVVEAMSDDELRDEFFRPYNLYRYPFRILRDEYALRRKAREMRAEGDGNVQVLGDANVIGTDGGEAATFYCDNVAYLTLNEQRELSVPEPYGTVERR